MYDELHKRLLKADRPLNEILGTGDGTHDIVDSGTFELIYDGELDKAFWRIEYVNGDVTYIDVDGADTVDIL